MWYSNSEVSSWCQFLNLVRLTMQLNHEDLLQSTAEETGEDLEMRD